MRTHREKLKIVTAENKQHITNAILGALPDYNFTVRMINPRSKDSTKTLMVWSTNKDTLQKVVKRIKTAAAVVVQVILMVGGVVQFAMTVFALSMYILFS